MIGNKPVNQFFASKAADLKVDIDPLISSDLIPIHNPLSTLGSIPTAPILGISS